MYTPSEQEIKIAEFSSKLIQELKNFTPAAFGAVMIKMAKNAFPGVDLDIFELDNHSIKTAVSDLIYVNDYVNKKVLASRFLVVSEAIVSSGKIAPNAITKSALSMGILISITFGDIVNVHSYIECQDTWYGNLPCIGYGEIELTNKETYHIGDGTDLDYICRSFPSKLINSIIK